MRILLRGVLAVVAGFVAASLVMMVVESINGHVLYPDLGKAAEGVTDQKVIREIMASAPSGALVVVICGWILGSLAGGAVSALLAPRRAVAHSLLLGVLLTLAGIANNLMIPPPLWFWIASMLVFIPAAYAGARLTGRP